MVDSSGSTRLPVELTRWRVEKMTVIIVSASIVIPTLIGLAIWYAKKEDEQLSNIMRRLEELEKDGN